MAYNGEKVVDGVGLVYNGEKVVDGVALGYNVMYMVKGKPGQDGNQITAIYLYLLFVE